MKATWATLATLFALAACSGGSDTDTDTEETDTDDGDPGGGPGNRLTLTVAPTGDYTGFTPTESYDGTTWLTQQLDPAKVATLNIAGEVLDFEDDVPRTNTQVQIWEGDVATGQPDSTADADANGRVSMTAPSCQPITYLAYPDPAAAEAMPTYKAHQVYGADGADPFAAEFISVSISTYLVIPAIVGITPEPGKSVIAGTGFDVTREPDTLSEIDAGKVEGAEVVVKDLDGNYIPDVHVKYFVEKFPDRDQPHTSADGLWTAINVPPGDVRVEMWGLVDDVPKLLGSTQLKTYADSINIANIFAGYNGVKYPTSCLAAE